MEFVPKEWKDYPDLSTPVNAETLQDVETRLAEYADTVATEGIDVDNFVLTDDERLNDPREPLIHNHALEDLDQSGALDGEGIVWNEAAGEWIPVEFISLVEPNIQATPYELAAEDHGTAIELNSSSPITLTVPINSNIELPVGFVVEILQLGTGTATISPEGGVTIRSLNGVGARDLSGQYAAVSLRKRATNEWVLSGALAEV